MLIRSKYSWQNLPVRRGVAASLGVLGTFAALGLAALALQGVEPVPSVALAAAQTPTFARDVAPIIFGSCSGCHNPEGIGPMPLLSYEDVSDHADDIRDYVSRGVMPPWHALGPRDVFRNDRRLSDEQKRTIIAWIDAGKPRGSPAELPPAPKTNAGWGIGTPDTVITMPRPFVVPAQGEIPYQHITVATNFAEDRWVQAIEVMPGARQVVHHVLVYSRVPAAAATGAGAGDTSAAGRGVGGAAGAAGTGRGRGQGQGQGQGQGRTGRGGAQSSALQRANRLSQPPSGMGTLIATTAPGTNAQIFPQGTALRIPAGAVLTFQMHYTAHGEAMEDQTSLGLVFAKQPPAQEMHASYFLNARLLIPAGASDHQVDAAVSFPDTVRIWGILPHTHLRGKRWEYRLVTPDGESRSILSVPNYDFNWQTYYMFREPLVVPAGSRIESSAWYDNSAGNRSNPDPTVEVRWGEQTWEEMQYTGFLYTEGG